MDLERLEAPSTLHSWFHWPWRAAPKGGNFDLGRS